MADLLHNVNYPPTIKVGNASVSKIMLGNTQVWPRNNTEPPIQTGFSPLDSESTSIATNGDYYLITGKFKVGTQYYTVAKSRIEFKPKYIIIHNAQPMPTLTYNRVYISWSQDGVTWTTEAMTADKWIFSCLNVFNSSTSGASKATDVAWNGNYWVICGVTNSSYHTIATSTDGLTWIGRGYYTSYAHCVAWNGVTWAVGGVLTNNSDVWFSTNGGVWSAPPTPVTGGVIREIKANSSYWIFVGQTSTDKYIIKTGDTANNWTLRYTFSGQDYPGMLTRDLGNNRWLLSLSDDNDVIVALTADNNGVSWQDITATPTSFRYGDAFCISDDKYLYIGRQLISGVLKYIVAERNNSDSLWTVYKVFADDLFTYTGWIVNKRHCIATTKTRYTIPVLV